MLDSPEVGLGPLDGADPDDVPPSGMLPESKPDAEGAGSKVTPFGAGENLGSQVPMLTVS